MQVCSHDECPNCCYECETARLGEALKSCLATARNPDADPMVRHMAQDVVEAFKDRLRSSTLPGREKAGPRIVWMNYK